jgi:hypothetical protein
LRGWKTRHRVDHEFRYDTQVVTKFKAPGPAIATLVLCHT